MFSDEYYADLDSVPARLKRERSTSRRNFLIPSSLLVGVSAAAVQLIEWYAEPPLGYLLEAAVVVIAAVFAWKVLPGSAFARIRGRSGFLCGYSDCRRLISPLFFWECPYCHHSPDRLDISGKASFISGCENCGRKPLALSCPHCDRPLPLLHPEQMPSPAPPPARIFLPASYSEPEASVEQVQPPPPQHTAPPDNLADVSKYLDRR